VNVFLNIPLDVDTRIISECIVMIGVREAVHQSWLWDGIQGESIIFKEEDVQGLMGDEIKSIVSGSPLLGGNGAADMTISLHQKGFVFVNFNFETSDTVFS